MDGRILSEAMTGSRNGGLDSAEPARSQKTETRTLEAIKHFRSGTWRQSLQTSRVGSTVYLDEGNGAFVANQVEAVSGGTR